ncbi:protein FAR1-RELATED SEQUENCE 5-like [Salvia miltiorrhiza]|uniref:protein FAR1-RELATED SEQUENCE 5-like n=1 Tax=Salvia miltiorrhiza TaxID=226208 RepID=UPI0025AC977E|nr:protein FAR1-RELATED SEQUENCE 5-like [Salvia miltiorrhiza]
MSIDLNVSCGNDGVEDSYSGIVGDDAFRNDETGRKAADLEEDDIEVSTSPVENESSGDDEDVRDCEDMEDSNRFNNFDNGGNDETEAVHCSVLCDFSVRKGSQCYFLNTAAVRAKIYHCSCHGSPDNKCSIGRVSVCKRQSYRSNCNAKLRVAREDVESPWKVTIFDNEHNHKLLNPSESYLLRSARNMSQSKKILLVALTSSGIGVSRAYRFLENEAGSRANIGFLRKDVYNVLNSERREMAKVANADANKLLEYFTDKGKSDPSFYWRVKIGDDGRLKNLFFRDTRYLVDYQHFGDVVSVNATYKTNKYDLACVPIIEINHHRTNVMFAMTFLSNEKSESYEWLFSTFLDAMYRKEPTIIFSDQDKALMNALDNTFHGASHRLCQWHINKNAGKQFGKLNYEKDFKRLWFRCMNGCENAEEFDATWNSMMEEFNLSQNRWFKTMYNLRKRWPSAFTVEKFSGGLHATSRSEVTNKVIKELCSSTSSVYEFILGFEKLQKNWRTREFEEDALCRGMPGMFIQRSGILVQLGELCTQNIFKLFEAEILSSVTVKMTEEPLDLNVEEAVFKNSGGYVLNRWRRESKERIPIGERAIDSGTSNNFANMVFVNHNMKRVYDLLSEFKDNKSCRDAMNEYIGNMIDGVHRLAKGKKNGSKESLHRPIRDPLGKRKRKSRRKMCSKMWEHGAQRQNHASSFTADMEDEEEDLVGNTFWPSDSRVDERDASLDRFSMD